MINIIKITKIATNIISKSFVKVGQASYHIFLVQMVYFWAVASRLSEMPIVVYVIINIIVCIVIGLLFFEFENNVRSLIKKYHNKNVAA